MESCADCGAEERGNMKVTVYNCRAFDEKALFEKYGKELGIELVLCPDAPDEENASLAQGSQCIDILTSDRKSVV